MYQSMISRIKIKNYKCHKLFDETLAAITVLAGENAAGKSSLIQSILLSDYAICSERKSICTYNIYGNNLGAATNLISQDQNDNYIEITLFIDGKEKSVTLSPKDYDESTLEILKKDDINPWRLFYINAERLAPKLSNSITGDDAFYVGVNGQNTINVIDQLDKLLNISGNTLGIAEKLCISNIKRFSANCEEWLNMIIPGTKIKAQVFPEQGISTIKYQNYGDVFYGATSTGFGITYVLPIVVQALAASCFKNSVIIVENPEAHLHPYSQSMIGQFLAAVAMTNVQVIIETHSEHFINGCRLKLAKEKSTDIGRIIFFERNSGIKHQRIDFNDSGELSKWPKGFFDQNQIDLRELLTLRRCKK